MNILSKNVKNTGTEYLNDSNAFIECSNTMGNVYDNIDEYNPSRKRKPLIAFDGMIAGIMAKKDFKK